MADSPDAQQPDDLTARLDRENLDAAMRKLASSSPGGLHINDGPFRAVRAEDFDPGEETPTDG